MGVFRNIMSLAVFGLATVSADDNQVTCGSAVKLRNADTAMWLHSHQINWGSGSGQQSVTLHGGATDQGSLWVVRSPDIPSEEGKPNASCELGQAVRCGDVIRLTHQQTQKNLHSHPFQSPLSRQQEVSGFGEAGNGDASDNWEVECLESNGKVSKNGYWNRNKEFRLKHHLTSKYLASSSQYMFTQQNCPNCPIIGQQEVAATDKNNGNKWITDLGVYFNQKKQDKKSDEF